jgi:hypothetical protein
MNFPQADSREDPDNIPHDDKMIFSNLIKYPIQVYYMP